MHWLLWGKLYVYIDIDIDIDIYIDNIDANLGTLVHILEI